MEVFNPVLHKVMGGGYKGGVDEIIMLGNFNHPPKVLGNVQHPNKLMAGSYHSGRHHKHH